MGESQDNPFIGNPFMQTGSQTDKPAPPSDCDPKPQPHHQDPEALPLAPPAQLSEPTAAATKKINKSTAKSTAKAAKPSKATAKAKAAKAATAKAATAKAKAAKAATAKAATAKAKAVKAATAKAAVRAKRKRTSQPVAVPSPTTTSSGHGYKVQVLAKIPMPSNPNMPSRDYLWFAVYPIIPRVGDCIFHDGRYFRVDAVFLYENTNAGWCADLEVSYYTRRY